MVSAVQNAQRLKGLLSKFSAGQDRIASKIDEAEQKAAEGERIQEQLVDSQLNEVDELLKVLGQITNGGSPLDQTSEG